MKTPSKKLLTELVLIATVVIGQAHAGTTLKAKTINNANKQTSLQSKALVKVKPQHKVLKSVPTNPVKNKAAQQTSAKRPLVNNRVGATAPSAIANQPPVRNGLKARLSKKGISKQFNNPNALNGFKRLNPIEALAPNTHGTEGTVDGAPTIPNTARPSIIGQDGTTGNGVSEQQGSGFNSSRGIPARIVTHRGGVTEIRSTAANETLLIPTPAGGIGGGPEANLAIVSREGDLYVIEHAGGLTYVPVGHTDTEPGNKPAGSNTGGKDTNTGGKDTNTGGKDTDTGGKDTDTGGKDTDTGGKDTDTGGKDTDTGGKDTDTGGKGEGTTKRGVNSGDENQHGGVDVVGDFMADKTGEKKRDESPRKRSFESNSRTQPGVDGDSNSTPGAPTVGDGTDSGNAGPKNNLWTNPYISPAERRGAVVNPDRFEEQDNEINHAVGTLEDIGNAVNPHR